MSRWEPDARGRLEQAALELFGERGFAETTVAEIAARAGLTERTFFRYYADKREVLFWGAPRFERGLVEHIAKSPPGTAPIECVVTALEAASPFFGARREAAQVRHQVIVGHTELLEREVMKLAALATATAQTLRDRGLPEPAASLIAETGIAIFKIAFQRWLEDPRQRDFARHVRLALTELRTALGAGKSAATRARPAASPARSAKRRTSAS